MPRESHRLIGNAIWSGVARGISMIAGFVVPPLAIASVGKELYGVVVLISAALAFGNLLALGTPQAMIRFVGEAKRLGKHVSVVSTLYSSGTAVLAVASTVILVATSVVAIYPSAFLNLAPELDPAIARPAVVALGAASAISLVLSIGQTGFFASEAFRELMLVRSLNTAIRLALVVTALIAFHGSLGAYVGAHATAIVIESVALFYFGTRLIRPARIRPRFITLGAVRRITSYGTEVFANTVFYVVYLQGGMLILGTLAGAGAVASFGLASTWAMAAKNALSFGLSVLLPAASKRDRIHDVAVLQKMLLRSTKFALLVAVPIAVFLVVFRYRIFESWLGPGFETSAQTLVPLVAAETFAIAALAGANMFVGMGDVRFFLVMHMLFAPLSLLLTFLATGALGLGSLGLGLSYAATTGVRTGFVVPVYMSRRLELHWWALYRFAYARPLLCALMVAPAAIAIESALPSQTGWLPLVGAAAIFAVIYSLLAWLLGADRYDRRVFLDLARRWRS